jgi:uncharacterized protein (DUF302 family)
MDAITTLSSSFDAVETVSRLEAEVRARGMTVFARIDHAAGALAVGMPLRPTVVVLFGSARAGTPLMQADQKVGLDLPLRALVWEDPSGKVSISYEDPAHVADRHGLSKDLIFAVTGVSAAMRAVVNAAARR